MLRTRFISPMRRAVTLTEVVIAVGILALISAGSISTMLVSSRMSRDALEDLLALEVVNRQTELLRSIGSGQYALLGTDQVPEFFGTVTFEGDPEIEGNLPEFNITYDWYGFGFATGGGTGGVSFDQSSWPSGVDFTGHRVVLRPTGAIRTSGIANITSHSNGSFSINAAINGHPVSGWGFNVPAGTYFEVDAGKWVRMTASWTTSSGSEREVVREIFLPWRSPLGN